MHGAIRIGSQAKHWMKDIDLSCPSCKQKCNDVHLFLECPTSVQAWKHVEDFWTSLQDKFPMLKNYQVKQTYKLFGPPMASTKNSLDQNIYLFLDILLGHMQTIIWNTYCSRIYSSIEYDTSAIIKTFDSNIKKSLRQFTLAMKQTAYIQTRWGCPKLPQAKLASIKATSKWKNTFALVIAQIIPSKEKSACNEKVKDCTKPNREKGNHILTTTKIKSNKRKVEEKQSPIETQVEKIRDKESTDEDEGDPESTGKKRKTMPNNGSKSRAWKKTALNTALR